MNQHLWRIAVTAIAVLLFLSSCTRIVSSTFSEQDLALHKVYGTAPCDQEQTPGSSGVQTLRLFLENRDQTSFPIEALRIPNLSLSNKNLEILYPTVLNAENGQKAANVKVLLSLEPRVFPVYPHPNYMERKRLFPKKRPPKAIMLLLEESDTANAKDPAYSRRIAIQEWLRSYLHTEKNKGPLDLFGLRLMRHGILHEQDNIFFRWPNEEQFIDPQGQKHGLIYTTHETKNSSPGSKKRMIRALQKGGIQHRGNTTLYDSVIRGGKHLRALSANGRQSHYTPALIAMIVQPDRSTRYPKELKKLHKGIQQLQSTGPRRFDFIPFMGIQYPNRSAESENLWGRHLQEVCQLSKASSLGINGHEVHFGQIFHVHPNPQKYESSVKTALIGAYHAMRGYVEAKMQYQLIGAEPNQRYLVTFALGVEYKGRRNLHKDLPIIGFYVET